MGMFEENKPSVEWSSIVDRFAVLTKRVWWVERLRAQYYLDVYLQIPADGKLRYLIACTKFGIFHLGWVVSTLFRGCHREYGAIKNTIFLLNNNPAYLANLLPVLKELMSREHYPTVFVRHRDFKEIKKVLTAIPGTENLDVMVYEELAYRIPYLERPVLILKTIIGALGDLGIWLKSGLNYRWFLLPRVFTFAFVNRYYSHITKAAISEVSALVSADDRSMWEALIFQSVEPDTRTCLVQHGVLARTSWPTHADKVLVWGEGHRNILIKEMGAQEGSVLVTGATGFGALVKTVKEHQQCRKDTVCFLAQFHGAPIMGPDGYNDAVEMFCQLAEKHRDSGIEFVVKLHPRDRADAFDRFLMRYGEVVHLADEGLLQLLGRSVASVLVDSTALFESVIMDVPVIQLKPKRLRRFADFSKDGLSLLCFDLAELDNQFVDITGSGRVRLLENMVKARWLYLGDPESASRTAARIITNG